MVLPVSQRIGMLRQVLEIRRGVFSLENLADVLGRLEDPDLGELNAQVLSRMFHGSAPDRIQKSGQRARIVQAIVDFLCDDIKDPDPDFWTRLRTTPDELSSAIQSSTSAFLAYLARVTAPPGEEIIVSSKPMAAAPTHDVPVLTSVASIPREGAEHLYGLLGGKCLLYRLGLEPRSVRRKGHVTGTRNVPVLRRIPVLIEDTGKNYLRYCDQYDFYQEEPEKDWADGYFFYTKEHFTVIAADYDHLGVLELFLMQLKENPVRGLKYSVFQGLMVMNGDLGVPTACKIMLRQAPQELQGLEWEEFANRYQAKIDLKELPNGDYQAAGKIPSEDVDGPPLNYYANFLQIKNTKIELDLR